jgi:hypothetical protein
MNRYLIGTAMVTRMDNDGQISDHYSDGNDDGSNDDDSD